MSNKTRRPRLPPATFRRVLNAMVSNVVQSRLRYLTDGLDGDEGLDPVGRNLNAECGYPQNPTIRTFRRLYDREGYATRVVHLWPDECWAVRPWLYEVEDKRVTKFERAWQAVNKQVDIWHYLHRLDRLSGIGEYGVMLLGFDDGKKPSLPAPGFSRSRQLPGGTTRKTKLLYCQVFSQDSVTIKEVEKDPASSRFGKPVLYDITVFSPSSDDSGSVDTLTAHWSRIIHAADNCESNDVLGTPRQRPVVNRLLDLRKILGGSAEMFWKGAFPGMLATTQTDVDGSAVDEETVREQFEEYMNGLKRYMAFDGMDVQQMLPQTADPTAHVMQQVTAICATIGCPVPVFLGQQEGHLAGITNSAQWNRRVTARCETYVEQKLIRPTVDRLIAVGVLPRTGEGEYLVSFKDLNTMSDKDRADVSLKKAQALMQYVTGKCEAVLPLHEFLTMVMGYTPKEASAIVDAVELNKGKELTDPLEIKKSERDADLQIKVAKATPAPKPISGTGKRDRKVVRTQGGGRRASSNGGRTRGTVSRS